MARSPTPSFSYVHVFEPGTVPAAPPLLLLHGTGGNEHDLLRLGRTLSPGSALLSPRGDVNEGGALRFFSRIREGVFDPAEITRRTHALADFLQAAAGHYRLDLRRLVAIGFSNGANIAATVLLLRPECLGDAVLLRPMVVLDRPATAGSLAGRRVLLCHGSTDPLVPPEHRQRLAELFAAGGATISSQVTPASHALTPRDVAAAQAWLQGATAAPANPAPGPAPGGGR
ncbi:MAG: alpha/beta hydrolase [Verrucomicrobia bacterium]|nr:alpha/beta hydrolase [Verrucomicrobiota bacterium]